MKTVYCTHIPFEGYLALNFFGIVIVRKSAKEHMNSYIYNHEAIHTAQMKELLYIGFYLVYLLQWLFNIFYFSVLGEASKGSVLDQAYRGISFEREAYLHEYDLKYLRTRKHFSQWRKRVKKS